MKRKPMLFHKIMNGPFGGGREVIGLIGTHHGVGVTHTGLMLAFYLGEELGKKTAFLECNNHHDMMLIQEAYDWNEEGDGSFSFHQITCFKEVTSNRIINIFGEAYDCLILDFGTDFLSNREEFLRCSTKIVVGGSSEWDIQKLSRFTEATKVIHGSASWKYFIPQADDKKVTRISNELQRKVWSVPRTEEPTLPSYTSCRFFSRLFQ